MFVFALICCKAFFANFAFVPFFIGMYAAMTVEIASGGKGFATNVACKGHFTRVVPAVNNEICLLLKLRKGNFCIQESATK